MAQINELRELIKTLTKAEKRYFRVFASRHSTNNDYLILFDTLDSIKEDTDEEKVSKKLRQKGVKLQASTKTYLYNLILKSMRVFRSESNISNEISDLIQDELFLMEKELLPSQFKTIQRAKELAYKFEQFHYLLIILDRERRYQIKYGSKDRFQLLDVIHREENDAIEKLVRESAISQLYFRLWAQYTTDPLLNDPVLIEEYNALKSSPLLSDQSQLNTFRMKWNYYRCHSLIARFNNENEYAVQFYGKIIELFEEYPHQKNGNYASYIDAITNYLAACHRIQKYDSYEKTIQQLYDMASSATNLKDELNSISFALIYKLLLIMNTCRFDKTNEIIEEVEYVFRKYGRLQVSSSEVVVFYDLAILLFLQADFSRSLHYVRRLYELESDVRKELQAGARMLEVILHYEMDNTLLVTSLLRNASRLLQKEKKFDEFEKILFGYIKLLNKEIDKSAKQRLYHKMYSEIEELRKARPNYKFVIINEVRYWLQSKLYHTSINVEAMKELIPDSIADITENTSRT